MHTMNTLLEVKDLKVRIPTAAGMLEPVRGVSFGVDPGQTLCLVGESGCGKSLTSLAVMDLLPDTAARSVTSIQFDGKPLHTCSGRDMEKVRGNRMAMIFQEPMTALNPAYTVGNQLVEVHRRHCNSSVKQATDRAVYLLNRVGISAAQKRLGQYPHQLSGGLRQRVMIAMALMCSPRLIIADEPTTALDVTIQAEILTLLQDLQQEYGLGLVLITHDLGVVAQMADRVAVMYAGQVVESGTVDSIFNHPVHPYTQGLLGCIPDASNRGGKLGVIPGRVPKLFETLTGCLFFNRCSFAHTACRQEIDMTSKDGRHQYRCVLALPVRNPAKSFKEVGHPLPENRNSRPSDPLVDIENVQKEFLVSQGLFKKKMSVKAVDGVNLSIERGETLGLVGESGCGKSTLAMMVLGLLSPTSGDILIDGHSVKSYSSAAMARRVQPVFQDPYASLNPRRTMGSIVSLFPKIHGIISPGQSRRQTLKMLDEVGLPGQAYNWYASQMSGGQRQRVAIARALIMQPELVVCDEPTSALDVSVQSQILNLLIKLREDRQLTYLFISHNLSVVRYIASRVAVMYLGQIVEQADTRALFNNPRHPYTRALINSVFSPSPGNGVPKNRLAGQFPNPLSPPSGCRFHPRCPEARPVCRTTPPEPLNDSNGMVCCHLYSLAGKSKKTACLEH